MKALATSLIFLQLVLLVGCAPKLTGTLSSVEGQLDVSEDARVNVVRLTGQDAGDDQAAVSVVVNVKPDGSFVVEDLPRGEYLVEAIVPGYRLTTERIDLREQNKIALTLVKLPASGPSAVGANTKLEIGRGAGGATLTPPTM